jgi:hypothetical protein
LADALLRLGRRLGRHDAVRFLLPCHSSEQVARAATRTSATRAWPRARRTKKRAAIRNGALALNTFGPRSAAAKMWWRIWWSSLTRTTAAAGAKCARTAAPAHLASNALAPAPYA